MTEDKFPDVLKLIRHGNIVAQGAVFSNGKCVLSWLGEHASTVVWDSIESMQKINCHEGTFIIRGEFKNIK